MNSTNWESVGQSRADKLAPAPGHPIEENVDEQLTQLVAQTCGYPRGSIKRRQSAGHLIRAIIKSGKLWRENTPDYEEALQQTWLYLCRNLCEANTGAQYDPTRSSVTTWLNHYLKRRLQDFRLQEQAERKTRVSQRISANQETTDPLENLAATPDIPPMLEETRHWVETDPDGDLRRTHIKGRPDLTCQVLIVRRFPPEIAWETLAVEFNCSVSTLASFYQRQCLPRLRKFAESEGYL